MRYEVSKHFKRYRFSLLFKRTFRKCNYYSRILVKTINLSIEIHNECSYRKNSIAAMLSPLVMVTSYMEINKTTLICVSNDILTVMHLTFEDA